MINDWFELQDKQFFVDGVNSLAHRWEKRVVLEGDYIEKLQSEFDHSHLRL